MEAGSLDPASQSAIGRRQSAIDRSAIARSTGAPDDWRARGVCDTRLTPSLQVTIILVMKIVTLATAKATLSALLDEVERGRPIAISRRHRVVAEVRPAAAARRARERPAGLAKGDFTVPADFDAPLPDDVLAPYDGR